MKLEFDVVSCVDTSSGGSGSSCSNTTALVDTLTLHNCLYQADLKRPLISHLSCRFATVFDENADNEFVYKNSGSQQMVTRLKRESCYFYIVVGGEIVEEI